MQQALIELLSYLNFIQIGLLVAGGYNEGRLTMFYPFNTNYVRRLTPADGSESTLGNERGWEETGWLPDDRKVKCAILL